jgi:hypothetical protein
MTYLRPPNGKGFTRLKITAETLMSDRNFLAKNFQTSAIMPTNLKRVRTGRPQILKMRLLFGEITSHCKAIFAIKK